MQSGVRRVGEMEDWELARPVTSWWGAMIPPRPLRLAVVDPRLGDTEASEMSGAIRSHARWRTTIMHSAMCWVAFAALGALAVQMYRTVETSSMDYLMEIPGTLAGCAAILGTTLLANGIKARRPPERVRVRRDPVDRDLWAVAHHLNGYREGSDEQVREARRVLWALAHTDGIEIHSGLISSLARSMVSYEGALSAGELASMANRIWEHIPERDDGEVS